MKHIYSTCRVCDAIAIDGRCHYCGTINFGNGHLINFHSGLPVNAARQTVPMNRPVSQASIRRLTESIENEKEGVL